MNNICIVSFCNLYYLPYASLYIDKVMGAGAKCTLLLWDRDAVDGENDKCPDGCDKVVFQYKEMKNTPGIEKVWGYVKATRFFRKVLRERDFSGVIFLQTQCAVACGCVLQEKYKGKFILDIRDYFYDDVAFYRRQEKKLIDISYANVISSPAYRKFLPEGKYYISHNYSPFEEKALASFLASKRIIKEGGVINISYVGTVRFLNMDKKILRLFANDKRFSINYYGRGSEVLEKYCKDNNIQNVRFYGSFSPSQVMDFYKETDLINNLYGNHTNELDYALSNKIYHAGQLHIPILVCPETYMQDVSQRYKMGFVFDVDEESAVERLYQWYTTFDRSSFDEGCNRFIDDVKRENVEFDEVCMHFIDVCSKKDKDEK